MTFDLEILAQSVSQNGTTMRIVIADFKGSSPRETGTAMLVWSTGQSGTIGGGALEFNAIAKARAMLDHPQTTNVQTIALGPNIGQCCGGSVTLVFECFTAQTLPAKHTPYTRAINSNAATPLWVSRAQKTSRNASAPAQLSYKDGWLSEAIDTPKHPVWIYGAGHVGRALVGALDGLPFAITWVDTAPDRFPNGTTKNADRLIARDPSHAVKHAPAEASHFIPTYSHAFDLALCHAILSQEFSALGLIGSATKRARFSTKLRALGHSDAQISRINCPIGDPGLGKQPKAIAVGVVAALLTSRASNPARKEVAQ